MFHNKQTKFNAVFRRIKASFMSICLLAVCLAMPFSASFNASAKSSITAMHLHEWNSDAGVEKTVSVVNGKTYTFTVLWKYEKGEAPYFQVGGDAIGSYKKIVVVNDAQSGAEFDRSTGKVTYTFKSNGTSFNMSAGMGNPATSGGEKGLYFAQPTLFESDDNGNAVSGSLAIDCDKEFNNSWEKWPYGGDYRHVETVENDFFNGIPSIALSSLDVGYNLSPSFYHDTYEYSVSIPYNADQLAITYKLVDGATLKNISGNSDFKEAETKDVTISVNNTKGGITTYTIHVTKKVNPGTNKTAMYLHEWNSDAGVENTVSVIKDKTYTLTVFWKYVSGEAPYFQVGGDAIGSYKKIVVVNKAMSGAKIDRNTGKLTYTFKSEGTSFNMSAGMGTPATGGGEKGLYFSEPTLFESDSSGNAVSGGNVIDCDPEFETSWIKWSYGGDYRHVVTVENNFFNGDPSIALSELSVGYDLSPVFYHGDYEYSTSIPYNADSLNITYKLVTGATIDVITGNSDFKQGVTKDVTISVKNTKGQITTYTVHVTKQLDPSTIITAMHLYEWNTDAGVENTVSVEKGKTYTFTVLWKYIKGETPSFQVGGDAIGTYKTLMKADEVQADAVFDNINGILSYTFVSNGTSFIMSGGLGSPIGGGQKELYFASPTLFESDSNGNRVNGGSDIDCNPKFDKSWTKWDYGGDYRHVEGVAPDFFVKKDFPDALTSLNIGYDYSPSFDYRKYVYDVTVPYTVNQLDLKYTLASGASIKEISGNSGFEDGLTKKVIISVNDDKGGVTNYTIRVKREVEPSAALTSLSVGYEFTPSFDSGVYNYTLSVPNNVQELIVNHTETTNSTFKSVTGNKGLKVGIPTDVVVTIANSQGKESKYTITVTRQGIAGDTTAMKQVLGTAVSKLSVTNSTDANKLKTALSNLIGNGYTAAVADFYKMDAVPGAEDDEGVIVPGVDGYISAIINLTDGNQLEQFPITVKIKAPMTQYLFEKDEISKTSDFELEDGGKYLSAYTGNAKKIIIPDGVQEIGFGWNQSDYPENAIALVIPDSVKTLPANLGYGMQHLEAVYMGDGSTEILSGSFDKCIFLQYIRFSENLRTIGPNAFSGTCSLTYMRLPQNLETIGENAFYFSLIRNITIPSSVKSIGKNAFATPFNAPYQLVKGSDNEYRMYIFKSIQDADCKRLMKISDEVVDYTDSKGNKYDKYDEAPIGIQWGENNAWPNGSVYVTPREITILNKNIKIEKDAFYTVNGFYAGGINVRMPSGSSAIDSVRSTITMLEAKREENLKNTTRTDIVAVVGLKVSDLNMSLTESASRAQFMANTLVVTEKSTSESVKSAIKSSYVSDLVLGNPIWTQAFKISNVSSDKVATGILQIKNDKMSFEIILNRILAKLVNSGNSNSSDNSSQQGTIDTGFSKDKQPLKIKKGSKLAFMDWENGIIRVVKDITIKQLLNDMELSDGYILEFYDNDGYYIPEQFYDVAYLEDDFYLRLKKGYSRVNEFVFETTDSLNDLGIGSTATGDNRPTDNVIVAGFISALLLAGSFLLLKRKKR